MNERSTFTIGLEVDLSKLLKDLPVGLDKMGDAILSKFSDATEKVSKGLESDIADIKVNLLALAAELLVIAGIVDLGRRAIYAAIESYRATRDLLKKEIREPIDIEKNIAAQEKIVTEIIQKLDERRKQREKLGDEVFFALNERFPSDDLSMEEIIKQLTSLILTIKSAREELETIKSLISITKAQGEQLKNLPELEENIIPKEQELIIKPIFSPSELELPPDLLKELNSIGFSPELGIKILDFINKNQQLNDEINKGNTLIDERSSLFPLLNNALVSSEEETSAFTIGQGLMTDAFNGSTISAVNLAEKGINPLTGKANELGISLEDLFQNTSEGAVIFGYTKEQLDGLRDVTDDAAKSTENLGENGLSVASEKAGQAGKTVGTLDANLLNLADRNKDVADSQDQVNQAVGDGSVVYDDASKSAETYGDTVEEVQKQGGFFEGIKQGFIDFVENVESNSELMADFFADTLSGMSQNFSDLFYNVLTGKFDDLKDVAKNTFKAILKSFLDLVAAIVTKQIVISIGGLFGIGTEGEKSGPKEAGGNGDANTGLKEGSSILGGIGSFFGKGFSSFKALFSGTTWAGSFSSIVGTVTSALSFIGAIVGAAFIVFSIVSAFLKKTPRLDIDFDSVKTEMGRRAAEVAEFLDPEFFKEQIAQISVKRGGVGLGQGGDEGIKDIIQEKIEETVEAVQAIIFKLPSDLAKQLNEALLNTKVDIDTVVKGERLLEFDAKGKEIKKKFEAFINGELQAKFLFAIRDFFTGAFEALGVLPENAQAFVDEQFERFKNAGSREERAQIGQEFLASFNAFVDAFNIVSGNVNDAIGQTIQKEERENRLAA